MIKEEKNDVLDKVLHELDEATDILISAVQTTSKERDTTHANDFSELLYHIRSEAKIVADNKNYD